MMKCINRELYTKCNGCSVISLIKSLYLHNVITTKINMGNQFNVRKENSVQTKGQKKSKGERLGWESLSGYRPVPLRTVVGDGIPVSISYGWKLLAIYLLLSSMQHVMVN